jgi:hypothetical protein
MPGRLLDLREDLGEQLLGLGGLVVALGVARMRKLAGPRAARPRIVSSSPWVASTLSVTTRIRVAFEASIESPSVGRQPASVPDGT